MGREIRLVPESWNHPKKIYENKFNGSVKEGFHPMYQSKNFEEAIADYKKELAEWLDGYELWNKGFYKHWKYGDITKEKAFEIFTNYVIERKKELRNIPEYGQAELMRYKSGLCLYSDLAGQPPSYPNPEDYMPTGDWYQLFETVSEGTPLTPAFKTKEELIDWLTNNVDYWGNQWDRAGAESIVNGRYAPSGIISNGQYYEPEKQHLIKTD